MKNEEEKLERECIECVRREEQYLSNNRGIMDGESFICIERIKDNNKYFLNY